MVLFCCVKVRGERRCWFGVGLLRERILVFEGHMTPLGAKGRIVVVIV
jgi:hypothetical protein